MFPLVVSAALGTLLLVGVIALLALYGVYLSRARETSALRAGQLGLAIGLCCGGALVMIALLLMA